MDMKSWATTSMALLAVTLGLFIFMDAAASQSGSAGQGQLVISRAKKSLRNNISNWKRFELSWQGDRRQRDQEAFLGSQRLAG